MLSVKARGMLYERVYEMSLKAYRMQYLRAYEMLSVEAYARLSKILKECCLREKDFVYEGL